MFQNYEILKISGHNTMLSAILVYAGLAAASFCYIKKTSDNSFLNRKLQIDPGIVHSGYEMKWSIRIDLQTLLRGYTGTLPYDRWSYSNRNCCSP